MRRWLLVVAVLVAVFGASSAWAVTPTSTATATNTPTPTATSTPTPTNTPTPITATDDYKTQLTGKAHVFDHSALITPSDFNELVHVSRGILISVDGALKVDLIDGTTITYPSGTFLVKTIYWIRVRRVYSTTTTATGIVTFW